MLPPGGLFHEKTWRIAPSPFCLPLGLEETLRRLGHHLEKFLRACAQLYRMSADGRMPAWIAELLDYGKPPELIELQRALPLEIPKVIRPDLILTREGFVIAELDNVPGGIGLTGWLAQTYESLGCPVTGGAAGMLNGFTRAFPGGDVVISQEAQDYRPEMDWLTRQLNEQVSEPRWRVVEGFDSEAAPARVYRFFELFDLENVPGTPELMQKCRAGEVEVTPPFKPALEEKLWFALFWLRPLERFWLRALGSRTLSTLRNVLPYTWLVNPEKLPVHAVLPRLGVHDWQEVAALSHRDRHLILKISGFSPRAWGSRGVVVGSDVSGPVWAQALQEALDSWPHSPWILQEFHHSAVFKQEWWEPGSGKILTMDGRVRLCPYYFVAGIAQVELGGILATVCPSDKKLLHGMPEAVLAPATATKNELAKSPSTFTNFCR